MDKQTIEQLEEFIFKAVQSGKQETSGLVTEVIRKIEPAIEKSIEKYVNGKIRRLDEKLSAYIEQDHEWNQEHSKIHEKLIESVNLNTEYRLQTGGGLVMLKFLLGFVGFGTIISLVMNFTK